MKIVYLITRADSVGGATVHVRDLAEALRARGHDVTALVGGEGPVTEEFASRGIPFHSLRNLVRPIRPTRDFLAVIEIARVLREMKPDLVATQTAKAGLTGRAACWIAGVPAVFTPHGWTIGDRISPRMGPVYRWAERMAAPLTRRIINVCEYEKDLAMRYRIAPADKLAVVHNGIPDIPAHLRADPARHPPRIAMVARFEAPKDHATLLKAVAGIRDRSWQLDFIGDGPLERLAREQAAALGIAGRVNFLGNCRDVAGRLAQAQIFALASRSEAFPISILEAMRAGLPVIASDVGGVREAVVPGIMGFLSPRGDVETLRAHVAGLAANPTLRQSLGAGARRHYEERFTLDLMIRRTLAVYAEALAGKISDAEKSFAAASGTRG